MADRSAFAQDAAPIPKMQKVFENAAPVPIMQEVPLTKGAPIPPMQAIPSDAPNPAPAPIPVNNSSTPLSPEE